MTIVDKKNRVKKFKKKERKLFTHAFQNFKRVQN